MKKSTQGNKIISVTKTTCKPFYHCYCSQIIYYLVFFSAHIILLLCFSLLLKSLFLLLYTKCFQSISVFLLFHRSLSILSIIQLLLWSLFSKTFLLLNTYCLLCIFQHSSIFWLLIVNLLPLQPEAKYFSKSLIYFQTNPCNFLLPFHIN